MFVHTRALIWPLLLAFLARLCGVAASPGIFEVDLIFPRNDTYEPIALMPVVFAVQNIALADPLDAQISFNIYPPGNFTEAIASGSIDLIYLNSSASDPFFSNFAVTNLYGTESTFELVWYLDTVNCSKTNHTGSSLFSGNSTIFTTQKGAQMPDLTAITKTGICTKTQNFVIDVVGFNTSPWAPGPSCAILATGNSTKSDPCAVVIDTAAASSIFAAVTATACAGPQKHIKCPSPQSSSAADISRWSPGDSAGPMSAVLSLMLGILLL